MWVALVVQTYFCLAFLLEVHDLAGYKSPVQPNRVCYGSPSRILVLQDRTYSFATAILSAHPKTDRKLPSIVHDVSAHILGWAVKVDAKLRNPIEAMMAKLHNIMQGTHLLPHGRICAQKRLQTVRRHWWRPSASFASLARNVVSSPRDILSAFSDRYDFALNGGRNVALEDSVDITSPLSVSLTSSTTHRHASFTAISTCKGGWVTTTSLSARRKRVRQVRPLKAPVHLSTDDVLAVETEDVVDFKAAYIPLEPDVSSSLSTPVSTLKIALMRYSLIVDMPFQDLRDATELDCVSLDSSIDLVAHRCTLRRAPGARSSSAVYNRFTKTNMKDMWSNALISPSTVAIDIFLVVACSSKSRSKCYITALTP